MKHSQRGFTLLELMIVMFIMSLLIVPMMNAFLVNIEERRIETTVAEISDLFQSAQSYSADNSGAWPDQATGAGCPGAITLLGTAAQGYLAGFNPTSVYGNNYITACPILGAAPRRFSVTLNVTDAGIAAKISGVLPATTIVGTTITTSVPLPAQIPALDLLLPRDGSRAMTGDLDMGAQSITNADDVEISATSLLSPNTKLSQGIYFAGIVKANNNTVYTKPICPSGLAATPVVVPAGNSSTVDGAGNLSSVATAAAQANPIGAQYAWAAPSGAGWKFNYKMAVYKNNAWVLNHQPGADSNFLAIYMKCM